ncbi:MAG TPA: hypothetical protein VKQ30_21975 [Ktedonobacterales bacterium]|nr:hypothetical protein [Ktedonobacterales bacterium]
MPEGIVVAVMIHATKRISVSLKIVYGAWLAQSSIPKLFINSEPGTMSPSARAFCRSWPAQSEVTVRGRHYPQEDSPDEVAQALASWMRTLR